ncbi:MAG: response regulator [Myxococcaceae bacterium]|nr:response regulator [Myxococcaceae bacterium]MCA3012891.1 response regulator [Myxococcaceae bacterium]
MAPTILIVDDNKELVSLLTSLFEDAGYAVVGASAGKPAIELGKSRPVALALVDLLLPDMMGFHLAEALVAARPGLSLVFMTGVFKGARHSKEALTRVPSALFVEKPFDAKQLLETVKGLVPLPDGAAATAPADNPDFEVELEVDFEDADQEAMELTGRIKVTGGGDITAELSGATLTATMPPRTGSVPPPTPLPTPLPSTPARLAPPGTFRTGQLKDNFPGLITAFYLLRETGELTCRKGQVKKVVYFEAGQPVFALSNLAADRFGQFLVRVGKIKPEQLADVAEVAKKTNRRTGDVLVERGLLRETERLYFVGQQVKSIIYSLFAWPEGEYVLTFQEKARAESIKLDVFPANFIARGVKKLYKPERIARLVRPEDRLMPSQHPPYQLSELELERWEAALLPRFDGTHTNAEVLALAQRPEHQVRAFLAAMLSLEVLVRRDV